MKQHTSQPSEMDLSEKIKSLVLEPNSLPHIIANRNSNTSTLYQQTQLQLSHPQQPLESQQPTQNTCTQKKNQETKVTTTISRDEYSNPSEYGDELAFIVERFHVNENKQAQNYMPYII
eukprot:TRINITY_DN11027_c0_g1_i1.p1 TRINITY_DN11027_c0_g1~~TRINITY_DN11027_c0_g1_i1.p1  ORF type:complete len:128 (-),score=29.84 TRINITY_DN11027_c0_g1_i1:100-456(-)